MEEHMEQHAWQVDRVLCALEQARAGQGIPPKMQKGPFHHRNTVARGKLQHQRRSMALVLEGSLPLGPCDHTASVLKCAAMCSAARQDRASMVSVGL
jgi:hypothetical protein